MTAPRSLSQVTKGLTPARRSGKVRHIECPASIFRTCSTRAEICWNSSHCLAGVVGSDAKLLDTWNSFSTTCQKR